MFDSTSWVLMRKRSSSKGTWFRLRHVDSLAECWIGSLYIAPHYGMDDFHKYLQEHLECLPPTSLPTYLGADVNAGISWHAEGHLDFVPCGTESKGRTLVEVLSAQGLRLQPPGLAQQRQPTSRPRREGVQGRLIHWTAVKHASSSTTHVLVDSCFQLGTDHDMLYTHFPIFGQRGRTARIRTGKRTFSSPPTIPHYIDQNSLEDLAKKHLKPPKGQGYKDNANIRHLFAVAKRTRAPQDWKAALRARKVAQEEWKKQRISRAAAGEWDAVRACKPQKGLGWEPKFAENVSPSDPHQLLHEHFKDTFAYPGFSSQRSTQPKPSPDIREDELDLALGQGKKAKSVGPDGVNLELLQSIAGDEQGKRGLLTWYNRILHSEDIPPRWHDSLLLLLPKCSSPQDAKQTRGIALGCAAEKIFARIVLNRCKPLLPFLSPLQCCAPQRQASDLIFCLHRLAELEIEWGAGICVLKLDIRAAFDHVNRDKLLEQLFLRLGDSEEYRIWESSSPPAPAHYRVLGTPANFQLKGASDRGLQSRHISSVYLWNGSFQGLRCATIGNL